jgi:hypothetical protein
MLYTFPSSKRLRLFETNSFPVGTVFPTSQLNGFIFQGALNQHGKVLSRFCGLLEPYREVATVAKLPALDDVTQLVSGFHSLYTNAREKKLQDTKEKSPIARASFLV